MASESDSHLRGGALEDMRKSNQSSSRSPSLAQSLESLYSSWSVRTNPAISSLPEPVANFFSSVSSKGFPSLENTGKMAQPWRSKWKAKSRPQMENSSSRAQKYALTGVTIFVVYVVALAASGTQCRATLSYNPFPFVQRTSDDYNHKYRDTILQMRRPISLQTSLYSLLEYHRLVHNI